MNTDKIMINVFGNLEATTANIYYKPLKQIIEYIEKINPQYYMIFCQPCIEKQVKEVAKYYKMEYEITNYLPKETLMIVADKEKTKPNYEKIKRKLGE